MASPSGEGVVTCYVNMGRMSQDEVCVTTDRLRSHDDLATSVTRATHPNAKVSADRTTTLRVALANNLPIITDCRPTNTEQFHKKANDQKLVFNNKTRWQLLKL